MWSTPPTSLHQSFSKWGQPRGHESYLYVSLQGPFGILAYRLIFFFNSGPGIFSLYSRLINPWYEELRCLCNVEYIWYCRINLTPKILQCEAGLNWSNCLIQISDSVLEIACFAVQDQVNWFTFMLVFQNNFGLDYLDLSFFRFTKSGLLGSFTVYVL